MPTRISGLGVYPHTLWLKKESNRFWDISSRQLTKKKKKNNRDTNIAIIGKDKRDVAPILRYITQLKII